MATSDGPKIDLTTVLSLASTVAILVAAHLAARSLLPATATTKTRILFVWHAFDALIHTCLEGSFLWNCFFVSRSVPLLNSETLDPTLRRFTAPGTAFLGHQDRLYGAFYGTNPTSLLWQEYAKADHRWGGADPVVISLELLTVFLGAPAAAGICYGLVQEAWGIARAQAQTKGKASRSRQAGRKKGTWVFMIMLATGELYGGFMTFCPDWLVASHNLDTSNWMYLWLYLVFFNVLWVFIPLWILYESYYVLTASPDEEARQIAVAPTKAKEK